MNATKLQFAALTYLYNYYNRKLFQNKLPECMVSIVRSNRFHGAFSSNKLKHKHTEGTVIHEILLDASSLRREEKAWHSTLVHEQVHLLEFITFGKCRSRGYHTKEWGYLMKSIAGLHPSSNGELGGSETGRSMSHYIIEGGAFEKAFNELNRRNLEKYKLPYESIAGYIYPITVSSDGPSNPVPQTRAGVKIGYKCNCGNKVWGKPGLNILCLECQTVFTIIPKQLNQTFYEKEKQS